MNKKKKRQMPPNPGPSQPSGKVLPPASAAVSADAEPVAERRPVPVFLIILLVLLVYLGDMYIMEHGGDVLGKTGAFPKLVFDPYRSYKELEDANPVSEEEKALRIGKAKFDLYCSVCHQPTGLGNPSTGVPPLAGSEWVKAPGPGRAVRIVLNSVIGPIQVAGKTFDSSAMLAWRAQLSDEDIAQILSYVRANREWGNNAPTLTPEKVKQVREATASRAEPWTVPETE